MTDEADSMSGNADAAGGGGRAGRPEDRGAASGAGVEARRGAAVNALLSLRSMVRTRERLARQLSRHTQRARATLDGPPAAPDGIAPFPRLMLLLHLRQAEAMRGALRDLSAQIEEASARHRGAIELLAAIPGVSASDAADILAELGPEMDRFSEAACAGAWVGLCPRGRAGAGAPQPVSRAAARLRRTLLQSARAAARAPKTYLRAQFLTVKARRGARPALFAVASNILRIAYCVLRDMLSPADPPDGPPEPAGAPQSSRTK